MTDPAGTQVRSIRVELSVHPDVLLDDNRLRDEAARKAQVPVASVTSLTLLRKSIDARHRRPRVQVIAELHVGAQPVNVPRPQPTDLRALTGEPEVIIVGAGPAGMFCALSLAARGVRAVIVDRGRPVAERRRDVAKLAQSGQLDPDSNYSKREFIFVMSGLKSPQTINSLWQLTSRLDIRSVSSA